MVDASKSVMISIFGKSNFNKDRINVEGKLIFHGFELLHSFFFLPCTYISLFFGQFELDNEPIHNSTPTRCCISSNLTHFMHTLSCSKRERESEHCEIKLDVLDSTRENQGDEMHRMNIKIL